MAKPKPPAFHIPIGRHRENGKVVLFKDRADQKSAMEVWFVTVTEQHPATLAAGACVLIGPSKTSYMDLRSRIAMQSRTADGAWQPAALSDLEC